MNDLAATLLCLLWNVFAAAYLYWQMVALPSGISEKERHQLGHKGNSE